MSYREKIGAKKAKQKQGGGQSADLQAGDQVEGTVRNKIILQIKLFEISFSILVAGCRLDLKLGFKAPS